MPLKLINIYDMHLPDPEIELKTTLNAVNL